MTARVEASEAARQAALAILPLLLSNPPFIPASCTSTSLNRRHQILESSPEDVEEYLITNTYPTGYPTATRSVELLGSVVSLAEEQGAAVIGRIRFKCPEKDEVLVGVALGDKRPSVPPLLLLLLKVEGDESLSDSYKYDNLLPIDVVPGPWLDTFEEAVSFRSISTEMTERLSKAFPEDTALSRRSSGTALDVLQSRHDQQPQDDLLPGEEEAQGGGEYIIDADEFWEGFDSDEGESAFKYAHEQEIGFAESEKDRQKRLQEEEDRYWEMYDQTGAASSQRTQAHASASNGAKVEIHSNGDEASPSQPVDIGRLSIAGSRHNTVKVMLKDAYRLMQEAGGHSGIDDFLHLAREAVQEVRSEGSGL